MLKGTRTATLVRLQPISIHGQLSYDVHYTFEENPEQVHVARVGPEAIEGAVQAGDPVRLDFLVGVVTRVHPVPH